VTCEFLQIVIHTRSRLLQVMIVFLQLISDGSCILRYVPFTQYSRTLLPLPRI